MRTLLLAVAGGLIPAASRACAVFAEAPVEQHMGIDLSNAWASGRKMLDGAVSLLPNLVLAAVIFVVFLFLASGAKTLVRRINRRQQHRQNLGLLLGQLTHTTIVIFGFLVAFSAIAPSFHASDLIKMLGVGSVAIGFAFQNILQNFLAGILLLLQEPFEIGDWISVTGLEGLVEDIQTRATVIRTAEDKKIVVPNALLFTSPVIVSQEAPKRAPKQHGEPEPVGAR